MTRLAALGDLLRSGGNDRDKKELLRTDEEVYAEKTR